MDITLRKINVVDEFTEETIAFTADVVINGVKAGIARNDGRGGMTMVTSYDERGIKLINAAEKWVSTQKDDQGQLFCALGDYVDHLLEPYLKSMDQRDYLKTIKKLEERNILFGPPFGEIFNLTLQFPITLIQASPNGAERLAEVIRKDVVPHLKDEVVILNGNLSESVKQKFHPDLFFRHPEVKPKKASRSQLPDQTTKRRGKRK